MSISFKKVIDFPRWQIYSVMDKNIKLPKTFKYVYQSDHTDKIIIRDDDDFDFGLVFEHRGFIFCKSTAQVPKIHIKKTEPMTQTVLLSANLNKFILESQPSKIMLNFIPSEHASPVFDKNVVVRYENEDRLKQTNPKTLIQEIIDNQTNQDTNDWYKNILKNCPNIHYQDVIKNSDFKKPINDAKFIIQYDFKTKNELELLNILEDKFVDLKTKIKIYEDISGKYKYVRNYCQKNKIRFKDGVISNVKFIEMKYSDFLKVKGLNPTISNLLD